MLERCETCGWPTYGVPGNCQNLDCTRGRLRASQQPQAVGEVGSSPSPRPVRVITTFPTDEITQMAEGVAALVIVQPRLDLPALGITRLHSPTHEHFKFAVAIALSMLRKYHGEIGVQEALAIEKKLGDWTDVPGAG